MNGIYIGIGGNQGQRASFLSKARAQIMLEIGPINKASSIYQTAAWGATEQADFYNQVLYVRSKLSPLPCLEKCLAIEKSLGRKRTDKWSSRTIDIDILFYNNEVIKNKKLEVPHPYIQDRNFVLVPLHEIAPHYTHPVLRKKIFTLLKNCKDDLPVKKLNLATL